MAPKKVVHPRRGTKSSKKSDPMAVAAGVPPDSPPAATPAMAPAASSASVASLPSPAPSACDSFGNVPAGPAAAPGVLKAAKLSATSSDIAIASSQLPAVRPSLQHGTIAAPDPDSTNDSGDDDASQVSVASAAAARKAQLAGIALKKAQYELALADAAVAKRLEQKVNLSSRPKPSNSSSKSVRSHPPLPSVATDNDAASYTSDMSTDSQASVKDPPGKSRRRSSKSRDSSRSNSSSGRTSRASRTSSSRSSKQRRSKTSPHLGTVHENPNRTCAFVSSDIKTVKFAARDYQTNPAIYLPGNSSMWRYANDC